MKRYKRYRPSGVEWIGEIPDHWNCLRIKRLTNVKRGASPRPIDDPKYFDEDGEFAWVRIADVTTSERYLESTTQRLSELGSSLSVKRYPGDFFLSIAGTVGKPIITRIKCCIHDGFVWFPHLKTNPEYLYYIFSTGLPYGGLGKWGTQLNLNTDTVGEIFIPLPEKQEMENMIRYLDERTKRIDKLIAEKQKLLDLLIEEKTATINHAVTKGLNSDAPMKDSGVPWLGKIPAHWYIKKIKHALLRNKNALKTGPFGSQLKTTDFVLNGRYKVYSQRNVLDGDFDLGDDFIDEQKFIELKEFEIFPGDILITTRGTIGKSAIFPPNKNSGVLHPCLIRIQVDEGVVLKNWITNYINNSSLFLDAVLLESNATTIEVIYGADLKEIVIPVPNDIREQQNILEYVNNQLLRIKNSIHKINKEIELLQEYRTALISEAVTGKIDVRGVT